MSDISELRKLRGYVNDFVRHSFEELTYRDLLLLESKLNKLIVLFIALKERQKAVFDRIEQDTPRDITQPQIMLSRTVEGYRDALYLTQFYIQVCRLRDIPAYSLAFSGITPDILMRLTPTGIKSVRGIKNDIIVESLLKIGPKQVSQFQSCNQKRYESLAEDMKGKEKLFLALPSLLLNKQNKLPRSIQEEETWYRKIFPNSESISSALIALNIDPAALLSMLLIEKIADHTRSKFPGIHNKEQQQILSVFEKFLNIPTSVIVFDEPEKEEEMASADNNPETSGYSLEEQLKKLNKQIDVVLRQLGAEKFSNEQLISPHMVRLVESLTGHIQSLRLAVSKLHEQQKYAKTSIVEQIENSRTLSELPIEEKTIEFYQRAAYYARLYSDLLASEQSAFVLAFSGISPKILLSIEKATLKGVKGMNTSFVVNAFHADTVIKLTMLPAYTYELFLILPDDYREFVEAISKKITQLPQDADGQFVFISNLLLLGKVNNVVLITQRLTALNMQFDCLLGFILLSERDVTKQLGIDQRIFERIKQILSDWLFKA